MDHRSRGIRYYWRYTFQSLLAKRRGQVDRSDDDGGRPVRWSLRARQSPLIRLFQMRAPGEQGS
jgi:hypothetical protein